MTRRALLQLATRLLCLLLCVSAANTQENPATPSLVEQKKTLVDSFELIWSTLRDQYWDQSMAKLNWQAIHDRCLRKLNAAKDVEEARDVMSEMIHQLPSSHLAIIPAWMYSRNGSKHESIPDADKQEPGSVKKSDDTKEEGSTGLTVTVIGRLLVVEAVERDSAAMQVGIKPGWIVEKVNQTTTQEMFGSLKGVQAAVKASLIEETVQNWLSGSVGSTIRVSFKGDDGTSRAIEIARLVPPGKLVQFGNLPPEHVVVEHRTLPNGVGYIRLNIFLDPVSVMPELEKAIEESRNAPGIVLDLRNNPGGLGLMAMGVAGWFVSQDGLRLGTMIGRGSLSDFDINPRMTAYTGRLAVLVNRGSASTSEILAQGLQDLRRARIFGTRTAGAALPSEIIELPDGDRFQYPEANYISVKGRVLEGNGVQPDVVVAPTVPALLAGRDLPLEAASAWSKEESSKISATLGNK